MNYELLPEHIPLLADTFAPFEIDPNFIYQNGELDGREIVPPAHAMTCHPKDASKAAGRLKIYPHWTLDKYGNGYWRININSAKDGCIEFSTRQAHKELNGKGNNYTPRPQISETERQRREAYAIESAKKQAAEEAAKAETAKRFIDRHESLEHELGESVYLKKGHGTHAALASSKDAQLKRGVDKYGEFLQIPIKKGINDEIQGVQIIRADGSKRIHGILKAGSHIIGLRKQVRAHLPLGIAEGYNTAMTCQLATGMPVATVFSASNIAENIKQYVADGFKHFVIFADNDLRDPNSDKKNTGVEAAISAAKLVKKGTVKIVIPDNHQNSKCDFNDLAQSHDLGEVKNQIEDDNNALFFENGERAKLKSKGKKDVENITLKRFEHDLRHLQIEQQIAEPNEKTPLKNKIIKKILAGMPKHYPLETGILRAARAIPNVPIETLRQRLQTAYNEKLAVVSRRNSLTPADLFGMHRLDIGNPLDVLKMIQLLSDGSRNNFFIHIPMGMGKSEFIGYLMEHALQLVKTLLGLPRVSLSLVMANDLNITHYKAAGRAKYNALHVACVVNSLLDFIGTMPEVAIFDEIRLTLESVISGSTMKRKQREIFTGVNEVMAEVNNGIYADADLNSPTVAMVRKASPDKACYYVTDSRPRAFDLPPVTYKGGHHDNVRYDILDDLRAGKNLYIASDSKGELIKTKKHVEVSEPEYNEKPTKQLGNFLKSNGVKKLLLVTQENKADEDVAAFLRDPNTEAKKYQCVLVSPVIQVGFSICNGWFDKTYALMGSSACTSNEIVQSMYRVRDVKEIVLTITPQKKTDRNISSTLMIDGFKIVSENLSTADIAPLIKDDELARLHFEQKAARNEDLNDLDNSILLHLENTGFKITYDIPTSNKKITVTAKDGSEIGLTEAIRLDEAEVLKDLKTMSISAEGLKELEKKKQNFKTEQSNTYKRAMVEDLAGVNCFTEEQVTKLREQREAGNDPITDEIISDWQTGMLKQVKAAEMAERPREELADIDSDNELHGIYKRETVEQDLLKELLAAVELIGKTKEFKTKDGKVKAASSHAISKAEALQICETVLRPMARQLAGNGHADYRRKFERPVQTLRNLFARFGRKITTLGRDGTPDRAQWFAVEWDEKVKFYKDSRAENRKSATPTHTI